MVRLRLRVAVIVAVASIALPAAARPFGKTRKGGVQPDRLTRDAMSKRIDRRGERAEATAHGERLFRDALVATGRGDAGVKAKKRAEKEARKQRRRERRAASWNW